MRRLLLLLVTVLSALSASAMKLTVDSVLRLGLPVVVVETVGGEEPTADVVYPPEGCIGTGIKNATKVPGRVVVLSAEGDTIFDSGDYVDKKSGMTVKYRGNSSSAVDKKAFKIKLQKKGDMLGRSSTYADKNWALLKNDWCNLNTLVSLELCRLMGQPWTPAMKYVNLVFNGDYRGLYMLSETVERNKDCRINVGKDGYVIESDPYWWNEDLSFDGVIDQYFYKFTFKYPDPEDITDAQLAYIKSAVADMENSILDGTYEKTIEVESFVNWLLIHDILGTSDSAGSNRFLTKKDSTASSLFLMGPAWDFDAEFGKDYRDNFARVHNEFYYQYLFASSNRTFANAYDDRWNSVKDSVLAAMHDYLENYRASDEATALEKSWTADDARWGHGWARNFGSTVSENIDSIEGWLSNRETVLDSLIAATTNGIEELNLRHDTGDGRTYNLMGQEVAPDTKGVVIRHGRKYVNR